MNVRFVSQGSMRPLRMSHRAVTGYVPLRLGGKAGYESTLERDLLMTLDFDPRVIQIQEQPFTLRYRFEGKERPYTPDVLAVFRDDEREWTVVYEVKYRNELREDWTRFRPRFKAAIKDCRQKGWRFKLVTEVEIRTPEFQNIQFLQRYKNGSVSLPMKEALLAALRPLDTSTPAALFDSLRLDGESRAVAMHSLWHLVAHNQIEVSLIEPLSMLTPIRAKS